MYMYFEGNGYKFNQFVRLLVLVHETTHYCDFFYLSISYLALFYLQLYILFYHSTDINKPCVQLRLEKHLLRMNWFSIVVSFINFVFLAKLKLNLRVVSLFICIKLDPLSETTQVVL